MNVAARPLTAVWLNPMAGVPTDTRPGFFILDSFKKGGVTIADSELVKLLFGLARIGYRGPIKEPSLSSLLAYAKDASVSEVLGWVNDDSGLLFCPSWQFPLPWEMAALLKARDPGHHKGDAAAPLKCQSGVLAGVTAYGVFSAGLAGTQTYPAREDPH